jgi:hypothetical protein
MRHSPLSLYLQLTLLAVEAQLVIGLRVMRLMAGGARAEAELFRMTSEKAVAATAAMLDTAGAMAAGKSGDAIARQILRGYRRRVRANHRRLTRR